MLASLAELCKGCSVFFLPFSFMDYKASVCHQQHFLVFYKVHCTLWSERLNRKWSFLWEVYSGTGTLLRRHNNGPISGGHNPLITVESSSDDDCLSAWPVKGGYLSPDSEPDDMGLEHASTLDERSVLWVYVEAPGVISAPGRDFCSLGFHLCPVLG